MPGSQAGADSSAGGSEGGGNAALRPARTKLTKTSSFRGVAATENAQWRARIRFGKYTVHLGRFRDQKDAALAYDRAATMLLGPSASLNFRDQPCRDPAAILHTAIIMQQALGDDAPAAVKDIWRGAALRRMVAGAAAAAPGAVDPQQGAASPCGGVADPSSLASGLLDTLLRQQSAGAPQLSPQALSAILLAGGRGEAALQALAAAGGAASSREPSPLAVEAAAAAEEDRGAKGDASSGLSSPSVDTHTSVAHAESAGAPLPPPAAPAAAEATAPAPTVSPFAAAAAAAAAPADGGRSAREAAFSAAMDCVSRLLQADPDLLTGYLRGIQQQSAGSAATTATAAIAAIAAAAAAAAAPGAADAPARVASSGLQKREREQPAAEGEAPQQRRRLEGGDRAMSDGEGGGFKRQIALALRASSAPAPLPAPPPPQLPLPLPLTLPLPPAALAPLLLGGAAAGCLPGVAAPLPTPPTAVLPEAAAVLQAALAAHLGRMLSQQAI